MSRTLQVVYALAVALAAGAPGGASAQSPSTDLFAPLGPNPLEDDPYIRQFAQAKFEASQPNPHRATARAEAAATQLMARFQDFLAERRTLDILLETSEQLLEAELAAAPDAAARVAALQRHWLFTHENEQIVQAQYEANSKNIADLSHTRKWRLAAEARCLEARAARPKGTGARDPVPGESLQIEDWLAGQDPRAWAKAQFEATQAAPRQRARARVEAARADLLARFQDFMAERKVFGILLECLRSHLEAEQALLGRRADAAAFWEAQWEMAREIDRIVSAQYEAGSHNLADASDSREARLEAQMGWVEARGRKDKPDRWPPTFTLRYLFAGSELAPRAGDFAEDRLLAQDKFAALRSNRRELARQRVAWARTSVRERAHDFLAERRTLDILQEQFRRLLEAEKAADPSPAEWAAALERYWRQTWVVELIIEAQFQAGSHNIADLAACQAARLAAEMRWYKARGRAKGK